MLFQAIFTRLAYYLEKETKTQMTLEYLTSTCSPGEISIWPRLAHLPPSIKQLITVSNDLFSY